MGVTEDIEDKKHKIRVKLYPNRLQNVDGEFIAKTDNEDTLSIEQVCSAMITRGGFTGNYNNLVEYIKQFYDEMAYQLCDGFAVNTGYYVIQPNIGGTFHSLADVHDPDKNPIGFRFRKRARLKNLTKHIVVNIAGMGESNACIKDFIDQDANSVNDIFIPGDLFSLTGTKIKVTGNHPDCGVFFVSDYDPSKVIKVRRLADNASSRITGIIPDSVDCDCKVVVRTQYTGSSVKLLKNPRTITSSFVLKVA